MYMKELLPENITGLKESEAAALNKNKKREKSDIADYLKILRENILTPFNALCAVALAALIFAEAPPQQLLFSLIFLANAAIGIILGIKTKLELNKISLLSSPTCTAVREGKRVRIKSEDIAVGDVIAVSAGDVLKADCSVIYGEVEADESILTGESEPIKRETGDKLYSGTNIVGGEGYAIAEKVGSETYAENMAARAKKTRGAASDIMRFCRRIIAWISAAIVPIGTGIFLINYKNLGVTPLFSAETFFGAGRKALNICIRKTCAVTVGMIPAGMMLLTAAALAAGAIRLFKKGALVKELYSIENLARTDILCLDKTGTLTDGNMKAEDLYPLSRGKSGFSAIKKYGEEKVIAALLNSFESDNSTSSALKEYFNSPADIKAEAKIPFSSERKFSAVTFSGVGTLVMGAPEYVFKKMSAELKRNITRLAIKGLRVVAVGYSKGKIEGDSLPEKILPYALITLSDSLKEGAREAVEAFQSGGVSIKVISGDSPVTAAEVAARAGIKGAERYISLEGLSEEETARAATEYGVFGRVTPRQKEIIVGALKSEGKKVTMTGDGVNDILALKEADCAVSFKDAAESAKGVSHIILGDKGFCALPEALKEGARVINNVEKTAALYLIKSAVVAMLAALCIIMREEYFFTTENMLIYETLINGAAATALALQKNDEKIKGGFLKNVAARAAPKAVAVFVCLAAAYFMFRIPAARNFIYGKNADLRELTAVMTIIFTFCGVATLYDLCRPFNAARAALFIAVTALSVFVFTAKIGGFNLSEIVLAESGGLNINSSETLLCALAAVVILPLSSAACEAFNGIVCLTKKRGLLKPVAIKK